MKRREHPFHKTLSFFTRQRLEQLDNFYYPLFKRFVEAIFTTTKIVGEIDEVPVSSVGIKGRKGRVVLLGARKIISICRIPGLLSQTQSESVIWQNYWLFVGKETEESFFCTSEQSIKKF